VSLKKKIRALTTQLAEAKQESSIAQLELRDRNAQLQEDLQLAKGLPFLFLLSDCKLSVCVWMGGGGRGGVFAGVYVCFTS
jgi:hypothetical protein